MTRRRTLATAAAALIALAVGIVAGVALLSSDDSSPAPAKNSSVSSGTAAPEVPTGWVAFRDARRGFGLYHPQAWRRLRVSDRSVSLLLERDRSASLLARATSVGLDVTPQTLPIVRQLTDRLVRADVTVSLLAPPEAVTIGGLPGYRYVYTFGRGATRGAHVHFFLFHRGRMITLVFQALPAARLGAVAPEFERIAQTVRPVDP